MLKKTRPVAIAGIIGALALVLIRGPQSFSVLQERQREIALYEKKNAELTQEIAAKQADVEILTSPEGGEAEVRSRAKLLQEGEITFIVTDTSQPVTKPKKP